MRFRRPEGDEKVGHRGPTTGSSASDLVVHGCDGGAVVLLVRLSGPEAGLSPFGQGCDAEGTERDFDLLRRSFRDVRQRIEQRS